jgi:hypothetical protein
MFATSIHAEVARRSTQLEKENARLNKLLADVELQKPILSSKASAKQLNIAE